MNTNNTLIDNTLIDNNKMEYSTNPQFAKNSKYENESQNNTSLHPKQNQSPQPLQPLPPQYKNQTQKRIIV